MKKPSHNLRHFFLKPRHWPSLAGMGILWCLSKLPWPLQYRLGHALGLLMYFFSKRRRFIAEKNLSVCFPEMDANSRKRLTKQHFKSMALGFIEFGIAWWASEKSLNNRSTLHGQEYLQAAKNKGNGVILLSAHFTCLELGGRLLSCHEPFNVMYRPNENPVIEYFMQNNRIRHFEKAIRRDDIRNMVKSLKAGNLVWYASDQNFTQKNSVFADFFNVPAATNTATSRLARLSGAAVVPFFAIRKADGKGYDLNILPALEDFPSEDPVQDAVKINQIIEAQVRKAPEQYLWVHRRFNSRPDGRSDFYDPPA